MIDITKNTLKLLKDLRKEKILGDLNEIRLNHTMESYDYLHKLKGYPSKKLISHIGILMHEDENHYHNYSNNKKKQFLKMKLDLGIEIGKKIEDNEYAKKLERKKIRPEIFMINGKEVYC